MLYYIFKLIELFRVEHLKIIWRTSSNLDFLICLEVLSLFDFTCFSLQVRRLTLRWGYSIGSLNYENFMIWKMWRLGSYISRGVYTVSGPFHPFGGAVDIIVVEQPDGSFKSSPWYVRFGKFQGVLKTKEKVVNISVNGVEADFHMYLDHKGEAHFLEEVEVEEGESVLYPSSSGEDTDGKPSDERPVKSKSCNFDATVPNPVAEIDVTNGNIVPNNNSRHSRILGLVFGRRSMKEKSFSEENGPDVARATSLERAEIAADLLEVQWSTGLAINKLRKDKLSAPVVLDADADKDSQINGGQIEMSSFSDESMENILDRTLLHDETEVRNREVDNGCELGFHEPECSVEEDDAQGSCYNTPKQATSGGGGLEEECEVISVIYRTTDESSLDNVDDNENSKGIISENSHVSGSTELGACPNKHLNDQRVLVLRGDGVAKDETGMDRVQSFILCETSESSRLDGFGEQPHKALYVPCGNCGEFHVHSPVMHETIQKTSEAIFLAESGVLVGKESSNPAYLSKGDCCTMLNSGTILESEVTSMNSVRNNVITESLSAVDLHLIGSNSVETEVLGVIHCDMFTMPGKGEIIETEVVDNHKNNSQQTDPCKPCMEPEEQAKLQNNCSISSFGNLVHKVQDEKNIRDGNKMNELRPSQDISISLSECSEQEQFLFGDLDDLKLSKVHCTESVSPDHVDKETHPSLALGGIGTMNEFLKTDDASYSSPDKFGQDNLPNDSEELVENWRKISTPIAIPGSHKVAGEGVGRLVESLPIMRSHDGVVDLDALHPCYSLDSNSKSSKWTLLRNNISSRMKSNADKEHQLANGQPTIVDAQISGELNIVPVNCAVGDSSTSIVESGGSWRLWPFSLRRTRSTKAIQPGLDGTRTSDAENPPESSSGMNGDENVIKPRVTKKKVRAFTPTSEQLASLNLTEGGNTITFTFSTAMLGNQQVDARIFLWKWNTRIVISDVDGTITKSDVLGQFMPLVGVDWSQTGVAHLFSAIKENGYQLLFLSARAISQAYITRQFLINLKQDGKALPEGPVVISPDGLFPSLFREVIRRAPHEFKIACLEDIKALFPSDCSPFYAGFGNRDTDEISYLKVGIPMGKIFIINPKGEVAVNRRVHTRSYTSLHALVNGMFPSTFSSEQEGYNSWNYWKLPPPNLDI